jgi:hypothetical protein
MNQIEQVNQSLHMTDATIALLHLYSESGICIKGLFLQSIWGRRLLLRVEFVRAFVKLVQQTKFMHIINTQEFFLDMPEFKYLPISE